MINDDNDYDIPTQMQMNGLCPFCNCELIECNNLVENTYLDFSQICKRKNCDFVYSTRFFLGNKNGGDLDGNN
jgi:hypothetical protein